jgi:hypothetical protein
MFGRWVILLTSFLSVAQPPIRSSVVLTQVGEFGEEIGPAHPGTCSGGSCRLELPIAFPEAACVVTAEISRPDARKFISLSFALKTCRPEGSNGAAFVLYEPFLTTAGLGPNQALTKIIGLSIGPDLNDLVFRTKQLTFVRVDAIFPVSVR